MKVRAAVTFAGLISMRAGETGELAASEALSDLLRCGYVERVTEDIKSETETEAVKSEAVGSISRRGKKGVVH